MAVKWYALHTYTGYEMKVKSFIDKMISDDLFGDTVRQIKIPMEEIVEMKNGKKKVSQKKIFPGYILIEMDMNDTNYLELKKIPGVTGFIGKGRNAKPLKNDEVEALLNQIQEAEKKEKKEPKLMFGIDEKVKVTDGAFKNFNGTVEEVNFEKGRLKVRVEIFGRSTPVELDFLQVEKL